MAIVKVWLLRIAVLALLIGAVAFSKANEWMLEKIGPAIGASGLQPPYSDIAGGIAAQGGAMALNSMPVVPGPGPDLPPVLVLRPEGAPRRSGAEMDALAESGLVTAKRVPGALSAHEEHPAAIAAAIRAA